MNLAKPPVLNDALTTTIASPLQLASVPASALTNPLLQSSWQGASAIAFIDASVADYQTLVAGVAPGTEVHLLDSSQDAITQITNTLLGRHNISSLHIVSHGEAGGLDFGTGKLNLSDLPEYAAQLQSWSKALTDDADILLYGCNVAQGELGKAFTTILSQLTGADVAASNDLTGSASKGGNWTLEFKTGAIESGLAWQSATLASYSGVLNSTRLSNFSFPTNSSSPSNLTNINGTLYFTATDPTNGTELWKSDGMAAGTVLVKDIYAGSGSSSPNSLTNVNGTLYFQATDPTNGYELWKSDGTVAGTVLVKDIIAGSGSSVPSSLTNVNGTLYFQALDPTNGIELWKSDGTAAGTVLVKDIYAGLNDSNPSSLTNVNGTLYFTAFDPTNGTELWKSDGTAAGTVLVKDIYAGSSNSSPSSLTNVNGTLYFRATDPTNGTELWKSDGTAAGTVLVKDIAAGSNSSGLSSLTNVNGTLYFRAIDPTNGSELWKSDGTTAGTVLVKDIWAGSNGSNPGNLTNVNGTLYFQANDGTNGTELWKSDGTAAGTMLVKDIAAGSNSSFLSSLTNVNGTLYFQATDPTNGSELWKSDGTTAGTVLVKDIWAGSNGSFPSSLTNVNGTLYFQATDGTNGTELWKSDGTTAGTVLVKDINMQETGTPSNVTIVGTTSYFVGADSTNGYELWKSDGTAAGTVLVKDIYAGLNGSYPGGLTNVNGTLYFQATDPTNGTELWKSDGTAAGTVLVKDIYTGLNGSNPGGLTNINGTLYFQASDGTNGNELWKSDGTAAGTVLVKDIYAGIGSSFPGNLTNVNGTFYFTATDPTNGYELWKSDGTAAGTVLVKDIYAGSTSSSPRYLTNVNGTLYFQATDPTNGIELWKSDGTAAGTVLVKDIWVGSNSSSPSNLTNINGTLYFQANDGTNGIELWKSDGTAAGTVLVKDINPGFSSFPSNLTNVNGTLFFNAFDPTNGYELWKSDGTAAGTVLVKDINPGFNSSSPSSLTNVNSTLYFRATDPTNGTELWKSDGTAASTVLVKDIAAGSNSSSPNNLLALDASRLLFFADDGINGYELWIEQPNLAPTLTVSGTALSYTENDPATLLDGTATVADADSTDFDTGTMTVSYSANGSVDDRLAIRNQGTSTGQIGVSGSNVTYGGTTIGTFTGGTGTTALVITFNASATAAAVSALLQNLTYANVSEAPSTAARTVQLVITDGDGGTSTAVTKSITVAAVNDAPTVSAPAAIAITEDTSTILTGISFADVDAGSGTMSAVLSVGAGTLTATTGSGVTVLGSSSPSITLNGTLTALNSFLTNSLTYTPALNATAAQTLGVSINDGGNTGTGGSLSSGVTNVALNVTAVNDAPILSVLSNSLNLDGINDYARTTAPITHNQNFTYEAWVKFPTNNPGWSGIITTSTLAGSGGFVQFSNNGSGRLRAEISGSSTFNVDGTISISDGNWHHVALTYDGASLKTYVDGASDIDSSVNQTFTVNRQVFIGAERQLSAGWTSAGQITEVRIWNATRTQAEIQANRNQAIAPNSTGLIGYWQLNQNSGTTANDLSSSGLNATLLNGATWVTNSPFPGSISLAAINEDAGAPTGTVGTLVSALVDLNPPVGGLDNITDADTGAVTGIAITAADTTNGIWFYSTNNGTNWTALGAVANTTARLLAADANTRVYFQPNANYNGTVTNALTFRAWDTTSGTNGNTADTSTNGGITAFSTVTNTAAITITAVNDAPVAANDALSAIAEDSGSRTISFASLLGNDSVGPANESTQTLTITALSNVVGGTAVISGTNINFTPTDNYNGAASFDYTVQDNGTTNGAADPKTALGTASFTLTEVNDAPVAANDALSAIAEDSGSRTISFASLLANDSTGPANESTQTLTITAVSNVVGGTAVINGTNIEFTPTLNYNGAASFDYTVQDNGTTNSANDFKTAIATASFTITQVNDDPVVTIASSPLSYTENAPATLLDSTATVIDTDSTNFDTGTLTVSVSAGATATDRLTIIPNGTVTLDGRRVLVSGTEIGTYRGGNGTSSLVISLNASATPANTQALVRAIAYSSVSDALPLTPTNRTVTVTLTDGDGGTSTAATQTISVTGTNDAAIVGSTQLLYDGSLNTTPQAQGWLFPPIGGTATAANGTTNFTTTSSDTIRNGFTRTVASGLNAATGYTLSFTAQVVSSTPNGSADKDGDGNPDRAGFNLIVISSDTTKAIELSFLTNEIFAQEDGTSQIDPSQQAVAGTSSSYTNTLFTRGEAATFTTTSLINYDLTVVGSLYTLYANGTAILSGRLRNYTAFSGTPDPYEVPNQIFFGDDTTSASGEINLSRVALTTNGVVNQTVNEDGSASVAIGLFDPDGTPPTVSGVTSGNTTLLPNANIATTGGGSGRTLTLTPAANQFGTATVTLNYNDGTASARTFDLVVNAVNDQPSVTLGSNQTVTAGSTAQTRTNWATFNPGAANEASQTATYTITNNTNPALFAVAPAIDSSGNLTYTPVSTLATATTATISVQVQDSGGTANGGIDTSTVQTFTITVKPQPTIVITSVGNNEGNSGTTPYTFTVNLSDTSTQTVSVNYATADSTATVTDGDYTAASGTLTFAPGETSKTFTVNVNGDTKYETNEVFAVNLANAVNGAIANGSTSVNGTIGNDDNVPVLNITPTVTHAEGNSGTTPYIFTVSLSNASYQAIGINYTTSDGTATTADGDYTAASGTLTFAPGETSKTITVNANGDTKFEPDETFRVLLSAANGSGAVNPGTTIGTATLTNDDTQPTISINNVSQNEGNSGTTAFTFTVNLSNASAQTVAVNYASADGTATTANSDYTAASGTLTFNPGETSKTITVNVIGDSRAETDETFQVNLITPTNGTIASNGGTGTGTIGNDDQPKLVWRNSSTGENAAWQLNGYTLQSGYYLPTLADPAWQIASSSADFNHDGIADLLWRNNRTGENAIWQMSNTGLQAGYFITQVADTNWQIVGTADFNGDKSPDIIWRNNRTGENAIWQMNGFTLQSGQLITSVADTNWQIVGTADFTRDGTPDLLWRNNKTGENAIWQMNGFTLQGGHLVTPVADTNWQIAGVADFNGDGTPDIVWRNKSSGENAIWQMNGVTLQSGYLIDRLADVNWQIAGVADLGGDSTPELLWRNKAAGKEMIWQLHGFSYAQTNLLADLGDPNWSVKPFVVA